VAADQLAKQIRKSNDGVVGALGGLAVGLGAGGAVAATVKPDLRSWHMLPAGFAALRVWLPPGKYTLTVPAATSGYVVYGNHAEPFEIQANKKSFVSLRAFKRGL